MIKKLGVIVVGVVMLMLMEACFPCNCKVGKPQGTHFNYKDAEIWAYQSSVDSIQYLNSQLLESDTVKSDTLSYRISFSAVLAKNTQKHLSLGFINTAYACSCPNNESVFAAKDPIVSLKIYTLNDFDNAHLALSDVTSCFSILEQKFVPNAIQPNAITDDKVKNAFKDAYGDVVPTYVYGFMVSLIQPPALNKNVSLKIVFTTQNGVEYTAESKPIYYMM